MKKNFLKVVSLLLVTVLICGFSVVSFAEPGFYPVEDYEGTYPTQTGKVFAGWYTDSTCKTPYTAKTGSAYAKFVNADVLSVKVQLSAGTTASTEKTNLRIVTTVDSLNYTNVGFKVTIGNKTVDITSKTVFKKIVAQTADESFDYNPSDICPDSAYFMTAVISNIPNAAFGTKIDIVPFWTTFDGAVVTGAQKRFAVQDGIKPEVGESDYVKFMKAQYPDYQESTVGLDITFKDDLVGICYSTWHDYAQAYNNGAIYNIADILAEGKNNWGPLHSFHYWSEPALGFYKSTDVNVIRTHMTQLSDAGVDFIIIDNTNALQAWKNQSIGNSGRNAWDLAITAPTKAILDTCVEMRAEGKKTPYIVFWNRNAGKTENGEGWMVNSMIEREFLMKAQYKDLFVYMRNEHYGTPKPLVIGTGTTTGGSGVETEYPGTSRYVRNITYRTMWGLQEGRGDVWSFLNRDTNNPRVPIKDTNTGKTYYEQISVSPAAQRTYMSTTSTAAGRNGGRFFNSQWQNAFKYRPKIVVLTWWNEWVAQSFPKSNGGYNFTDLYTPEYSRDLEPMKGGHGDQYYQWMKQYIEAYKAHESCPYLVK